MIQPVTLKLLLIFLVVVAAGCSSEGRTAKKLAKDTTVLQKQESSLTFSNITLEQADEKGQPLWKVNAKQVTYTNDQKIANVQNPIGDLFLDGKLVYNISALQGQVQQEGKKIILQGQIVATDIENGAILRGNELEWRPQEGVLIVRNQVTGTHKDMQMSAREARSFSREKRIELVGQVMAKAKEPPLQMRGEYINWQMQQQKVISDRAIQIDRYKGNIITDRAVGEKGEVDLKSKIATLQQNARVAISEPPLQVASNLIVWNLKNETVTSNQPVQVLHQQQQINMTANQGRVDLKPKIAYLTGNVQGIELKRKSQIFADLMVWDLPTQVVEATGNVIYRQIDPPLNLIGPKAVGKLQDQTVVVNSSSGKQVVTEIIP